MTSRISMLDADAGERRLFRVDKHSVPEHLVPKPLSTIQAIRFYCENDEADGVEEYYWRGKVRRTREYEKAVHELAKAICRRLSELGIALKPRVQSQPKLDSYDPRPSNGRVVFVAKPASDMVESYRALVSELQGTGYRVTPDSEKDLGKLGEQTRSAVVNALAEAEASVHLLGDKTGGRPEGLDMDLVPMQLAVAAEEARKKTGFVRMIWAPKVLLTGTFAEGETACRDPLSVVDRFGERLPTDQIDGDTASRFNEFVLQRLERRGGGPRYDHAVMAQALAQVTGRNVDEFLAKMDWRVDSKTGKRVQQDADGEWPKGSKTYPSFAYENRDVAKAYDAIKGAGVSAALL